MFSLVWNLQCIILNLLTSSSSSSTSKHYSEHSSMANYLPSLYSWPTCQVCQGSTYEANQCLNRKNIKCIHASQPFSTDGEIKYRALSGKNWNLKVEVKANVFVENLLNPYELTPHSIYNRIKDESLVHQWTHTFTNEQSIEVQVNISNVRLHAQYRDVYHTIDGEDASDNQFMHKVGNRIKRKDSTSYQEYQFFHNVLRHYCRQPLPDYYTLSLKQHGVHSSKIAMRTCGDSNDRRANNLGIDIKCPADHTLGDTYYYRQVSKPCSIQQERVELGVTNNSFVCVQTTPLLSHIFNMSVHEEFVSPTNVDGYQDNCRRNEAGCQECLSRNQLRCRHQIYSNQTCCNNMNCYKQIHCLSYFTKECLRVKPTCAKGDVNQYTLTPNFDSLQQKSFTCHLKYLAPKKLYDVAYRINITKRVVGTFNESKARVYAWISQPVRRTITSQSSEFHQHGAIQIGALHLRHWTNIDLPEQYFLKGSQSKRHHTVVRMSVHKLKNPNDIDKQNIQVVKNDFEENLHEAKVQLVKPFAVSSMSWLRHYCYVNASLFRRKQSLYYLNGTSIDGILPKKEPGDVGFTYNLAKETVHPLIKMKLSDTGSILREHFCSDANLQSHHFFLGQGKFTAQHNIVDEKSGWHITLTGSASALPAYLSVTIHELSSKTLLFKQNIILLESSEHDARYLHLNYTFPFIGLSKSNHNHRDATFEIHLADCQGHEVLSLTSLEVEWTTEASFDQEIQHHFQHNMSTDEATMQWVLHRDKPYLTLAIFLVTLGFIYLLLLAVYAVFFISRIVSLLKINRMTKQQSSKLTVLSWMLRKRGLNISFSAAALHDITMERKVILATYLCFRVFYNFLFTFTVFVSLILSLEAVSLTHLSNFGLRQATTSQRVRAEFDRLEEFGSSEQQRQLQYVASMHQACDNIFLQGVQQIKEKIALATRDSLQAMYHESNSLGNLSENLLNGKYNIYKTKVDAYMKENRRGMQNQLLNLYAKYSKTLDNVYRNAWLTFPQGIYNKSQFYVDGLYDMTKRLSGLQKRDVDFLTFLGIPEALEIHLLPTSIWKQFDVLLPDYKRLNIKQAFSHQHVTFQLNATRFQVESVGRNSRYIFSTADDNLVPDSSSSKDSTQSNAHILRIGKEERRLNDFSNTKSFKLNFNLKQLRLILMAIDLVILIHRFYHTFIMMREICFGKKVRVSINDSALYFQLHEGNIIPHHPHHHQCDLVSEISASSSASQGTFFCANVRQSRFFKTHYFGVVLVLSVAICLVLLVLIVDRMVLRPPLILRKAGHLRRLEALESSRRLWNTLSRQQAAYLNSPTLAASFRVQHVDPTQMLMRYVERYNHDQRFIKKQWFAESCSLVGRKKFTTACRLEAVRSFLVTFAEQSCVYLKVMAQQYNKYFNPFSDQQASFILKKDVNVLTWLNASSSASDVFQEMEALRGLILTFVTVLLCACFVTGIMHLANNLILRKLALRSQRTVLLNNRPPSGYDLLGRRIASKAMLKEDAQHQQHCDTNCMMDNLSCNSQFSTLNFETNRLQKHFVEEIQLEESQL